jgi:hypothetical protein
VFGQASILRYSVIPTMILYSENKFNFCRTAPGGLNVLLPLGKDALQSIRPYELRVSVVCDTLDYNTANQILAPIQHFPPLASCAIRLGQLPDSHLSLLAETAVRRLTGQPHRIAKYTTEQPW